MKIWLQIFFIMFISTVFIWPQNVKMRLAVMDLTPKSINKDLSATVSDLIRTECKK